MPVHALGPLGSMWLTGDYYLAVRVLERKTTDETARQQAAFAVLDRLAEGHP
ncbi:hypothetical protein D3C76_1883600 [compost metagenome]